MIFSRIPWNAYNAAIVCAFAATVLIALKAPLNALLFEQCDMVSSTAFMYLGVLFGMPLIAGFGRKTSLMDPARHLRKNDTVYLIIIILAGTAGSLMINAGLETTSAATGVVLNNFVIVATALFAFFIFREKISKRLWVGILLITLSILALSFTDISSLSLTPGALLILGGAVCYGFSYNIMKKVSGRNPVETSIVRAAGIVLLSFSLMPLFGSEIPPISVILPLMAIGFLTSGLGFLFTLYAQRELGAAKTGAISGIQPFLAIIASFVIFSELPSPAFIAALILFIPGMYFVITKRGREAEAGQDDDNSGIGDAKGLPSVSETRKTVMKNQLTSLGLLVTAMFFVMLLLGMLSPAADAASDAADLLFSSGYIIGLVFGVFLLIIGTLLLILGKRVLTAVTFILMASPIFSFVLLGANPIVHVLSGIFSIIFALILLTSNDPQKYAYAAVNLLLGAALLSYLFNSTVCSIIVTAAAAYLIWLAFSSGTGRFRYSLSKHLREDGEMTFGRCGAVIGYLLFAEIVVFSIAYQFTGTSFDSSLSGLGLINSFFQIGILVFVGVLLMIIGKRRTTSVFFIGIGIAILLDTLSLGVFEYLPVIFALLFGIMTLLRKDSPVLPAIILIGDAFSILLYIQSAAIPELQTATLLLTLGCGIVALYLSFAVFSEKPKLPVF